MAERGQFFVITLSEAHLDWGIYRRSASRNPREGEAYIPIPRNDAMALHIYNSNKTEHEDILGVNLFRYQTADGTAMGLLKAQGCSTKGDVFAKQFSEAGDLRSIGTWLESVQAHVGDQIKVTFLSPTDILLEKI